MFINTVYLYDDKLIIYYNLRDSRQVSYIEAIGARGEIENLRLVPDNRKSAVECSTAQTVDKVVNGLFKWKKARKRQSNVE